MRWEATGFVSFCILSYSYVNDVSACKDKWRWGWGKKVSFVFELLRITFHELSLMNQTVGNMKEEMTETLREKKIFR